MLLAAVACSNATQSFTTKAPGLERVIINNQAVDVAPGTNLFDALRRTASAARLGEFVDDFNKPPLLVIDGAIVKDVAQTLRNIPVAHVHTVNLMWSREAFRLYGQAANGGAIIVTTRLAP